MITPTLGMICTANTMDDAKACVINKINGTKEVQVAILRKRPLKPITKTYTLRNNGEWVRKGKTQNSSLTLTLNNKKEQWCPDA